MKSKNFLTAMLLLWGVNCYSQTEDKLSELRAPSSPASIILGNQPSVINSPKSLQSLEANLFSNFLSNQKFVIPNDYALEFCPYWAAQKQSVSLSDYLNPNPGLSLLQNLSLSISSTQNFLINDTVKSNALGFGIRSMIFEGSKKSRDDITRKIMTLILKDSLKTILNFWLASEFDENSLTSENYVDKVVAKMESNSSFLEMIDVKKFEKILKKAFKNNSQNKANIVDSLFDETTKIDSDILTLSNLKKERKGISVEIALASSLCFPTNETEFSMVPKVGIWLTPSYQPFDSEKFKFLGVLRYFHYYRKFYEKYLPGTKNFDNTLDYGARVEFNSKKFSLGFEGVGRTSKTIISQSIDDQSNLQTTVSKTDADFQWILNFSYRISEEMVIAYTFGRQFEPALSDGGTLLSLIALNLGFGAPKISNLDTSK